MNRGGPHIDSSEWIKNKKHKNNNSTNKKTINAFNML